MELRELLRQLIRELIVEVLAENELSSVPNSAIPGDVSEPGDVCERLTDGVLTEKRIRQLKQTLAVSRIVISSGVVITPLARDLARELNITLEREKPPFK